MRPLGVFHQKKIVFRLPSIIDTIYGNAGGEPALRVTVFSLTRSQSLPVGIFIANLKRGDWNEKKKWRRRG